MAKEDKVILSILIENLTLIDWLFKIRQRGSYIDASPLGKVLARLLGMKQLKFRLVDIHDSEGQLIRLRIAYKDLREVQDLIKERMKLDGLNHYQKTYMLKQTTIISKNQHSMFRTLYLIQIAHYFKFPVLYLRKRLWWDVLQIYATHYGVTLKETSRLREPIRLPGRLREFLKRFGSLVLLNDWLYWRRK